MMMQNQNTNVLDHSKLSAHSGNPIMITSAENFDATADYIGHYDTHEFLQKRPIAPDSGENSQRSGRNRISNRNKNMSSLRIGENNQRKLFMPEERSSSRPSKKEGIRFDSVYGRESSLERKEKG